MRNLFLSFGLLAVVAACGGSSNAAPANEPTPSPSPTSNAAPATTTTTETTTTTTGGAAAPATSTTSATATDAKCGTTTTTSASTMDACKAECEKLDDKAPPGTRCIPPRTSCKMNCDQKFKK